MGEVAISADGDEVAALVGGEGEGPIIGVAYFKNCTTRRGEYPEGDWGFRMSGEMVWYPQPGRDLIDISDDGEVVVAK